jgi:carbon starvation protein
MAYVFDSIPFMKGLMSYWYHFAIMFEAVFILTAVDAGTRVGRFLLQEMLGKVYPRFSDRKWIPGIIITGGLFTMSWGYLVFTGDISTIWPLFGMSNQLLASSALIIVTAMLIRMGKAKYMWVTAVPGLAMAVITMYAGYLNITVVYLPKGLILLSVIAVIIMSMMVIVITACIRRWVQLLNIKERVKDKWGDMVIIPLQEESCSSGKGSASTGYAVE